MGYSRAWAPRTAAVLAVGHHKPGSPLLPDLLGKVDCFCQALISITLANELKLD